MEFVVSTLQAVDFCFTSKTTTKYTYILLHSGKFSCSFYNLKQNIWDYSLKGKRTVGS